MCSKYCVDGTGSQLTSEHFDKETGALKDNVKLYQKSPYEAINGGSAYEMDELGELRAKYKNSDSALKAISDLEQRIKVYALNQAGDASKVKTDNFRIVDMGDGKFEVAQINKNNPSQATTFTNLDNEGGLDFKDYEMKFDATGGGSVTIDGKQYRVTKSRVKDEEAFNDAQAKYNEEKADYDRVQRFYEVETSKVQKKDKALDVKLERLANERAALTKQLDDLDKVKEDNTEKSFSAFS